jgi:hypothetical protein
VNENTTVVSFPNTIKIRKGSLYCQVMKCIECGMYGNRLKMLVTWKWNTIKMEET